MGRRLRKVVSMSLDPSVHERIRQEAEESRLSVSRYIEQALAEGFTPGQIVDQTTSRLKVIMQRLIEEHEERTRGVMVTACEDMITKVRQYLASDKVAPGKGAELAEVLDAVFGRR